MGSSSSRSNQQAATKATTKTHASASSLLDLETYMVPPLALRHLLPRRRLLERLVDALIRLMKVERPAAVAVADAQDRLVRVEIRPGPPSHLRWTIRWRCVLKPQRQKDQQATTSVYRSDVACARDAERKQGQPRSQRDFAGSRVVNLVDDAYTRTAVHPHIFLAGARGGRAVACPLLRRVAPVICRRQQSSLHGL